MADKGVSVAEAVSRMESAAISPPRRPWSAAEQKAGLDEQEKEIEEAWKIGLRAAPTARRCIATRDGEAQPTSKWIKALALLNLVARYAAANPNPRPEELDSLSATVPKLLWDLLPKFVKPTAPHSALEELLLALASWTWLLRRKYAPEEDHLATILTLASSDLSPEVDRACTILLKPLIEGEVMQLRPWTQQLLALQDATLKFCSAGLSRPETRRSIQQVSSFKDPYRPLKAEKAPGGGWNKFHLKRTWKQQLEDEKRRQEEGTNVKQPTKHSPEPILDISIELARAKLQLLGALAHHRGQVPDLMSDSHPPAPPPSNSLAGSCFRDASFPALLDTLFELKPQAQHHLAQDVLTILSGLAYHGMSKEQLSLMQPEKLLPCVKAFIRNGSNKEASAAADVVSALTMNREEMQRKCLAVDMDNVLLRRLSVCCRPHMYHHQSSSSGLTCVKLLRAILGVVYSNSSAAARVLANDDFESRLADVAALCVRNLDLTKRLIAINVSLLDRIPCGTSKPTKDAFVGAFLGVAASCLRPCSKFIIEESNWEESVFDMESPPLWPIYITAGCVATLFETALKYLPPGNEGLYEEFPQLSYCLWMSTPQRSQLKTLSDDGLFPLSGTRVQMLDAMCSVGVKGAVAHELLSANFENWSLREGLHSKLQSMLLPLLSNVLAPLEQALSGFLIQPVAEQVACTAELAEELGYTNSSRDAAMDEILQPLLDMQLDEGGFEGEREPLPWWRQPLSNGAKELYAHSQSHPSQWVTSATPLGHDVDVWFDPRRGKKRDEVNVDTTKSFKAALAQSRRRRTGRLWYHAGNFARIRRFLDNGFNVHERDGQAANLPDRKQDLGGRALYLSDHPFDALVHGLMRSEHPVVASPVPPLTPTVMIFDVPDALLDDLNSCACTDQSSFRGSVYSCRSDVNAEVTEADHKEILLALNQSIRDPGTWPRQVREATRDRQDQIYNSDWSLTWLAKKANRRRKWMPSNILRFCVASFNVASAELDALASAELDAVASAELEAVASAELDALVSAELEAVASAELDAVASAELDGVASAELDGVASAELDAVAGGVAAEDIAAGDVTTGDAAVEGVAEDAAVEGVGEEFAAENTAVEGVDRAGVARSLRALRHPEQFDCDHRSCRKQVQIAIRHQNALDELLRSCLLGIYIFEN